MKKPLLIVTSTLLLAGTSAAVLGLAAFGKGNTVLAGETEPETVEHAITLTVDNLENDTSDGTFAEFILSKEKVTYHEWDFSTLGSYGYGGTSAETRTGGHIFTLVSGSYYADAYFQISFSFKNVYSYTSIVLNGAFYYDQSLQNPETSIVKTVSDISDDYSLYEAGFWKVTLDSIVITYNCAI